MAALIKSQERAGGKPPRISRPVHPVKRLAPSKKKRHLDKHISLETKRERRR